jgi:hypothetical protein
MQLEHALTEWLSGNRVVQVFGEDIAKQLYLPFYDLSCLLINKRDIDFRSIGPVGNILRRMLRSGQIGGENSCLTESRNNFSCFSLACAKRQFL